MKRITVLLFTLCLVIQTLLDVLDYAHEELSIECRVVSADKSLTGKNSWFAPTVTNMPAFYEKTETLFLSTVSAISGTRVETRLHSPGISSKSLSISGMNAAPLAILEYPKRDL